MGKNARKSTPVKVLESLKNIVQMVYFRGVLPKKTALSVKIHFYEQKILFIYIRIC
jgi:hypothetical protein